MGRAARRRAEHYAEKESTDSGHNRGQRPLKQRARGELPTMTIGRMWRRARQAAFMPEVAASPLARTPYDLRHAAVSTWLNGGVPATTVAEWAGHSVEVLLRIYAKCLDGSDALIRQRVQAVLGYAGTE
jgi:integrase